MAAQEHTRVKNLDETCNNVSVRSLKFLSQIAAAGIFWTTTPALLKCNGKEYYDLVKKVEDSTEENMNNLSQEIKKLVYQVLEKIQLLHLQVHYLGKRSFYQLLLRKEMGGDSYTKEIWFNKLWDPTDEYFVQNFLTEEIEFDDYKLAKKLVSDIKCDPKVRFIYACNYCLTDHIEQNWRQIKLDELPYGMRFVNFWISYMKDPLLADWKTAFESSIQSGEKELVKYFWDKLTLQQKSLYTENIENLCKTFPKQEVILCDCPPIADCECYSGFFCYAFRENCAGVSHVLQLLPLLKQVEFMRKVQGQHGNAWQYVCVLLNPRSDTKFYLNLLSQLDNQKELYFDMLYVISDEHFNYEYPQTHNWYFKLVKIFWHSIRNDKGVIIDGKDQTTRIIYNFVEFKRWDCFRLIVKDLSFDCKWIILENYVSYLRGPYSLYRTFYNNVHSLEEGIEKSLLFFLRHFDEGNDENDETEFRFRGDALDLVNRLILNLKPKKFSFDKVIPILGRLKEKIEKHDLSKLEAIEKM